MVGPVDGEAVGLEVGSAVGDAVGDTVGHAVGDWKNNFLFLLEDCRRPGRACTWHGSWCRHGPAIRDAVGTAIKAVESLATLAFVTLEETERPS